MNINATLFGQMITFAIFVWFTLKYVWPPITQALEERQAKIAEGIKDAEKAHQTRLEAKHEKDQIISEARNTAKEVIQDAKNQANNLISEAKISAQKQHDNIVALAAKESQTQLEKARKTLIQEIASFAISGSEKILKTKLDEKENRILVDRMMSEEQS